MIFFLFVGLLLGAAAVIFILQNIITVSVVFFAWQLQGSLAVILLLAMIVGILITVLFLIPGAVRSRFIISSLKRQNKKLQDDLKAVIQTTMPVNPNSTATTVTQTTVTETQKI